MNLPHPSKPPPPGIEARITGVTAMDTDEVIITIARPTGARESMRGSIPGIPGTFKVKCDEQTCSADLFAPIDDVNRIGKVLLR